MVDELNKELELEEPKYIKPWGWYIPIKNSSHFSAAAGVVMGDYLHHDLNGYTSTTDYNKSGGGYFDTEEDAEKAISDYKQKWRCPTAKQVGNHNDAFDRAMKGI